jgi:hypothetical protein
MAYTVKIAGVDKTSLILARSLIIRLGADHRDSANFTILTDTAYLPRAGQAILIEDSGTVFAGLIASAPQVRVGASASIKVSVSAQGLYAVPGRRCASDTYADIDAGDIVSDLIMSYLAAEGITAGTITAGAHLDTYDTYGKTIGAALDELASVSGYQWYIDTAKALHFVQDIVIPAAAHDLDEAGAFTDYSDVSVNEDLDQYRNRQIIRGGIQADGTSLNYVAEDAAEIAARATIEGGSGVYEHVHTDTNIIDATNAAAVASNLLKKYGHVALAISFTSLSTDWRPATKLKVNLPSIGISSDRYFLIERVTLQDVGGATLRVLVEGVTKNESDFSTQMRDRYVDYFAKLLAGQKQVRDYTDKVAAGKTKSYFQAAQPTGGTYTPGDTWFDTDDDNRIYEWDGSAWVAVQFGKNAIADLAITDAKIANATISNAKIANVDAGKLTAGTIDVARLGAGSITFDKLASAAVTSITDTIDLGGRNLLRNTGSTFTNANYLMASYDMGEEWPVAGEVYTLSVKFTLGADRTHLSLITPESTVLLTTVADADKNSLGVASKTFTMSYAVGYTPADGYTNLVVYQMPSGGSAASTIEWVKLEKGNKATDWTPAPEDKLSEGVSYAGVEIDATNGVVASATIAGKDASLTMNATKVIEYLFDGKKRFGLSTDGYVYANRLYDPDDTSAYVQIGAVSGETGRSALTIYQTIGTGYTTHRPRLRLKSYGTTAFAIEGIVKPTGTDVEGTTTLTVEHGDSYLILADVFGMAYLRHDDLHIGIDDPDIYISKDNDTTRFKIPEIQTGTITLNDTTGVSVTFTNEFTVTPRIVLTAQTSNSGVITAKVTAKSTTGFTAIIGGTVSGNIAFDWIAMSDATE